jgi:hypothetical protein
MMRRVKSRHLAPPAALAAAFARFEQGLHELARDREAVWNAASLD